MENKERERAVERVYRLIHFFKDEMFKFEDEEAKSKADYERKCQENPDKQVVYVSFNNADVMKDCLRQSRDVLNFLINDEENDIRNWQLAGIHAMLDSCNQELVVPLDLPYAIKGILLIDEDGTGEHI